MSIDATAIALPARHLFTISIALRSVLTVGDTPLGHRRVVTVSGGRFEGQRLSGTVLSAGGVDWLLRRADESFQQDVRLTLQTDDDVIVLMSYRGVRHSAADVRERLARSDQVSVNEYYLRTAPFFETASPRYAWLNTIVSVGIGEIQAGAATYDVFEVL